MEQQKSSAVAIVIAILGTAIVVGGGMYLWNTNKQAPAPVVSTAQPSAPVTPPVETAKEPLSYATAGVAVAVSKETKPFDHSVASFVNLAGTCGTTHPAEYLDQLTKAFNNTSKTIYNFKYTGISQESDTYTVTLLPNVKGYTSLADFKKDFDICDAGGDEYPKMLNKNWLLFVNSCGSGASDDSGRPVGCDEVQKVVEPTLKLN